MNLNIKVKEKIKKVLKAYLNKEIVEFKTLDPNNSFVLVWQPVGKFEQLANLEKEPYNYRVKPTPKYVPFDNAEEFIIALQKHGNFILQKSTYYFPINVDNEGVMLHFHGFDSDISFKDLFERDWRFADGTICGKLINK